MKCFVFLLIFVFLSVSAITKEEFKHNQGSPEEFNAYKLPKPEESAASSDSSILSVFLQQVPGKTLEYEWTGDIFVDSVEHLSVTLASKYKNLKLTLEEPQQYKNKKKDEPEIHEGTFGWENSKVPSTTYVYTFNSDKRGVWKARIHTKQDKELPFDNKAHVGIVIENRSVFKAYSTTTNYKSHVGSKIGLTTRLYAAFSTQSLAPLSAPKAIPLKSSDIDMSLLLPNGMNQIVKMKDEGLTKDGKANDGVYGAEILAQDEGSYLAQVVMRGTNSEGFEFLRTTQHVIEVISEKFQLTDKVKGILNKNEIQFKLVLSKEAKEFLGKKYKAYAEVWENEKTPIAWMSGMSLVEQDEQGDYVLSLHLNLKWSTFKRSNVAIPTLLRNIYIQHGNRNVQISTKNEIKVKYQDLSKILHAISVVKTQKDSNVLTEDMIMGIRPKKYQTKAQGQAKLILSHGYCAGGNPFSVDNFVNYAAFNDPNQNRNIDDFALLLKEKIEKYPEGVSLAAHSQGGHASLHLFTYYWSSSDVISANSNNARRIQTVGTPWLGSGLAGSLAELGARLGFGCGNNYDLTRDGSKNWLANIPMSARKQVYYYKTQYGDWSWCNVAVNAVLSWPNDGTSENKYSDLEGGNNMGLTKKQCHTTGMKFKAQCEDNNRNKVINDNAARN